MSEAAWSARSTPGQPSLGQLAVQALTAALIIMTLVLLGIFARGLYVAIVDPQPRWVSPLYHGKLWTLVLGLGVAALATEAVFTVTGVRARHCRAYCGDPK